MNTLTTSPIDNITLYYREGSSDKVYQCSIEPAGDKRYAVTFAYGRRGGTLSTGTKTTSPVDYDEARRIFEKLVNEKMAKGYTPGADGTPYVGGNTGKQPSGLLPQLLNPTDEPQAFLTDVLWCMQEKIDGRRLLLRKRGTTLEAVNRKGLLVGMSESLSHALRLFPRDCVIDGEAVGDRYHAFDLLQLEDLDLRPLPYRERLLALVQLVISARQTPIRQVTTVFTVGQKTALFEQLRETDREGVVFKRLDAPYLPGRPESGGPALKHKFYATLSAVVARINAKRSIEIRLFGMEGWSLAGNVTIPPNHRIPGVGQVVEVRYLYGTDAGILYQPTYLGERSDIEQHECVRSQLKFKPTGEKDARA